MLSSEKIPERTLELAQETKEGRSSPLGATLGSRSISSYRGCIRRAKTHGAAGSTQPSSLRTISSRGRQRRRFPGRSALCGHCCLPEFDMKKLGQREYPRCFPIRVVSHACSEMSPNWTWLVIRIPAGTSSRATIVATLEASAAYAEAVGEPGYRLAAIPRARRDRRHLLQHRERSLPKHHRHDGMNGLGEKYMCTASSKELADSRFSLGNGRAVPLLERRAFFESRETRINLGVHEAEDRQ